MFVDLPFTKVASNDPMTTFKASMSPWFAVNFMSRETSVQLLTRSSPKTCAGFAIDEKIYLDYAETQRHSTK